MTQASFGRPFFASRHDADVGPRSGAISAHSTFLNKRAYYVLTRGFFDCPGLR